MSVRRHAMDRASRNVRISSPIALDRRRAELAYDALQELEQQFQLPIAGTGAPEPAWGTVEVQFDVDFFDAPEQRDSSLRDPQFTFGAFFEPAPDPPAGAVMVSACVQEWNRDARGAITGATITVGVIGDGAYEGYLHATFQGYGAIRENDLELDVGT